MWHEMSLRLTLNKSTRWCYKSVNALIFFQIDADDIYLKDQKGVVVRAIDGIFEEDSLLHSTIYEVKSRPTPKMAIEKKGKVHLHPESKLI